MIWSGQVAYYEGLKDLLVDIDSVTPAPWNYNNGDVDEIIESIRENGMYQALRVHEDTAEIIAGNHTWMACKSMDADVIPVIWLDSDQATAYRINVADNEIAKKARRDDGLLLATLRKIETDTGSLAGTGMTRDDMAELEALTRLPLDTDRLIPESVNWPTLSIQMPPELLTAFMEITDDADDNRERFELLLKMAGWGG